MSDTLLVLSRSQADLNPIESKVSQPSSKAVLISAFVLGFIALIVGGGFGISGLIHSYGGHLPHWLEWLVPGTEKVGFGGLWAIAVTGVVGGVGLIGLGAYKAHKNNSRPENRPLDLVDSTKTKEPFYSIEGFTKELINVGVYASEYYYQLSEMHFKVIEIGRQTGEGSKRVFKPEEREDRYVIVAKTKDCLKCSPRMDLATVLSTSQAMGERLGFIEVKEVQAG